jgi:hypothetical protein
MPPRKTPQPLRPRSIRLATPHAQGIAADLMSIANRIEELEADLSEMVWAGRDAGLSWEAIGFSVGTTGSAARKRWGVVVDDQADDDESS